MVASSIQVLTVRSARGAEFGERPNQERPAAAAEKPVGAILGSKEMESARGLLQVCRKGRREAVLTMINGLV
jgi:hypothetical protein